MTMLIMTSSQMNQHLTHRVAGEHERVQTRIILLLNPQGKVREQILGGQPKGSLFAKTYLRKTFREKKILKDIK